MARRPRSSTLENRTNRLKLAPRKKPYAFTVISPGVGIAYRRCKGAGRWIVRCADGRGSNWQKVFALADDFEEADGGHVLTFWQAQDKARALARGSVDTGRPVTVAEALDAYAADLKARDGDLGNVARVTHHLPPALAAKPVALLTSKELQHWRDQLALRVTAATVNRTIRMLKAALNLAAKHDSRIVNTNAWKVGLAGLRDAYVARNTILTDEEVRALIDAAYADDSAFGLYVEVAATTGARPSQLAKLEVGDVQADRDDPRLMMPGSRKGHAGKQIVRRPVPIPASLAAKLRCNRDASEPLLLRGDGKAWSGTHANYSVPFARARACVGLKPTVTLYSLRHSSIARALMAGVPTRLVAVGHDTSTLMIERSYSRFISDHADTIMRRGLLDVSQPAAGNIVALPGRRS
jgi:integrase